MAGAPHPLVARALRAAHAELKAALEAKGYKVTRFELWPSNLGEGWRNVRRLEVYGRKEDGREIRYSADIDGAALARQRVRCAARPRAKDPCPASKRFDAAENAVIPEDISI